MMMTVAELIAELEKHPAEMEVEVSAWVPEEPNRSGWTGNYFRTRPIAEVWRIRYEYEPVIVVIRQDASD